MKVAIVCLNLQWQAGGVRLIYSLAHGLAAQGNKVVIYAPVVNEAAFPDLRKGLDIRAVPEADTMVWTKLPSSLLGQVMNRMRQERSRIVAAQRIAVAMDDDFDAVNLHDFAYKVGLFYKRRNPKATIIWTENDPPYSYIPHGNALRDFLSRTYNWFKDFTERKYFRAIGRVAVLDGYNEAWCNVRGLHPVVIRSGVDFAKFYSPAREFKRGEDARIIAIGALNGYRRFEDIIEAVAILHELGRKDSLLIVAKDIWNEEACREGLVDLVKKLKLTDAVTLCFDGLSNEALKEAYAESNVYILSTYIPAPRSGYGWGLSNFEAMAAGLPIVICRTCTATEVLTDGVDAMLVEPCSPADIALKVRALTDNPLLAASVAAAGQDLVRKTISWDIYAKKMIELF